MRLKDASVNPDGITGELFLALLAADEVYKAHGSEAVITSMNDADHMQGSKHYTGEAADLRRWNVWSPSKVVRELRDALGDDYDVILERTHIHIEFDPD